MIVGQVIRNGQVHDVVRLSNGKTVEVALPRFSWGIPISRTALLAAHEGGCQ